MNSHTDRQPVVARLMRRFHELYADSTDIPSDHGLRMLAEEAFDVVVGDHRIVGRLFTPHHTIPVTVRVATSQDSERTVQVWGAVTGWSVTTATAEITSLEITGAQVCDGGLREVMTDTRDIATSAATPAAQAAARTVLRLLERLQPVDSPGGPQS